MYIIVDQSFTIIDGYRRYRAALLKGIKKVMVLVVDEEATLELRINLNIQRAKTLNDLIKELRFKISTITKKQGRKKDGAKLTYLDQVNDAFGKSWKDEATANKAVHVLDNDFENYVNLYAGFDRVCRETYVGKLLRSWNWLCSDEPIELDFTSEIAISLVNWVICV